MLAHPNDEELALYAELGSAAPNAREIEAHLKGCRECLLLVSEVRNLRDLELEGLLPAAPFRPGKHLASYLKGSDRSPIDNAILGTVSLLSGLFSASLADNDPVTPAFSFGHAKDFHRENEDLHERTSALDFSHSVDRHPPEIEREQAEMSPITRPDPIIGTPEADTHHFPGQQHDADTCAIRCQEFIVRQFTSANLPESYYVAEAKANNWYHEGSGTEMANVGKLLELHNIPVNRYEHANILNLTAELAQGHKVIIGVEADDLWRQHPVVTEIKHLLGFSAADHAVVVSGIDTSDPNHYKVIVSDPGTGQAAAEYPFDQFIHAWKESHYYMVATQDPPPESMHLPEMQNFDYHSGHIDLVGDMPYESFHALLDAHHAAATPADAHHYEEQLTNHLHPQAADPSSHAPEHHHAEGHGHVDDHTPWSPSDHEDHPSLPTRDDHGEHHSPSHDWQNHEDHHGFDDTSHHGWHHDTSDDLDSQDPDLGDDQDA
jgi:hypothetical protein